MTKEQLKEARARFDSGLTLEYEEIEALLTEVEQLTARCETLRALADQAAAEQGLAQRRMEEAQKARDTAFQRGAAAMQAQAAQWLDRKAQEIRHASDDPDQEEMLYVAAVTVAGLAETLRRVRTPGETP